MLFHTMLFLKLMWKTPTMFGFYNKLKINKSKLNIYLLFEKRVKSRFNLKYFYESSIYNQHSY